MRLSSRSSAGSGRRRASVDRGFEHGLQLRLHGVGGQIELGRVGFVELRAQRRLAVAGVCRDEGSGDPMTSQPLLDRSLNCVCLGRRNRQAELLAPPAPCARLPPASAPASRSNQPFRGSSKIWPSGIHRSYAEGITSRYRPSAWTTRPSSSSSASAPAMRPASSAVRCTSSSTEAGASAISARTRSRALLERRSQRDGLRGQPERREDVADARDRGRSEPQEMVRAA